MRHGLLLAGLLAAVGCTFSAGSYEWLDAASFERGKTIVPDGTRVPTHASCGEFAVLTDQQVSGPEPLTDWSPCWSPEGGDAAVEPRLPPDVAAEVALALEARAEERGDTARATPASPPSTAAATCDGLAPRDIERSPFSHRREIVEVVPYREGGEVRGARIVFKAVHGLSADWMRHAIACHQARYKSFARIDPLLPGDPTLVEGTTATVSEHGDVIDVLVTADSAHGGRVALARAEELAGPHTATR